MTGAVLIADLRVDDRGRTARVVQGHDLCRRLDLDVDLVLITGGGADAMPPVDQDEVRQFGCLPAASLTDDRSALSRFLLEMNHGVPYTLAHLCLEDQKPERSAARVWIADCFESGAVQDADLHLAPIDLERAVLATSGKRAMRLPFRPLTAGAAVAGKAVGWVGAWSAERIGVWSDALERLSRHGIDLSDGIVLMGPGADQVAVPDNLAQWTGVSASTGHLSILALAAAPGPPLEREFSVITECMSLGRPVLLSSEAAALHEDRWRLPTADTGEELFQLIAACRRDPSYLSQDLEATRRAFDLDLQAMTRHAAAEIGRLIQIDPPTTA